MRHLRLQRADEGLPDLADAAGMGVAVGKGVSAGAVRKPTVSNAAPTKATTRFTALDLPPGRHLRPIGANFMSGY